MYLSIPSGMQYKQIMEDSITTDYFVDPVGLLPAINIQKTIKEALQNNTGRKKEIKLSEFSIYLRNTPYTKDFYLSCITNYNGMVPTAHSPEIVRGYNGRKSSVTTTYGSLWFQQIP
jgi:hypothetical protein